MQTPYDSFSLEPIFNFFPLDMTNANKNANDKVQNPAMIV